MTDLSTSNGDKTLNDPFWRAAAEVGQNIEPDSFSDAIFSRLIIDARFSYQAFASWPTHAKSISPDVGTVLFASEDNRHNVTGAILEIDSSLVRLRLERGQLVLRLASATRLKVKDLTENLKILFPEPEIAPGEPKVSFRFSWAGQDGRFAMCQRTLDVVRWEDIDENYTSTTKAQLSHLTTVFEPGQSGQTVIWHGVPGTGKTNALRALSFEWRDWCDFTVATDPDALFGQGAGYIMDLLTTWTTSNDRWTVIVLEDAGELLSGDARKYVGQGLSRFLNICDGLLGQLQNVLLLVTTNEPMRRLHPAVRRPGRCAAEVEFRPFSVDEANAWLADRCHKRVSTPQTLAELYALSSDSVALQSDDSWPGIGFGSAIRAT